MGHKDERHDRNASQEVMDRIKEQRERALHMHQSGGQVATAPKPPAKAKPVPPAPAAQPSPVAAHHEGGNGDSRVVWTSSKDGSAPVVSEPRPAGQPVSAVGRGMTPAEMAQIQSRRQSWRLEQVVARTARQQAQAGAKPSLAGTTPAASTATVPVPAASASPPPDHLTSPPKGEEDDDRPLTREERWALVTPPSEVDSVKIGQTISYDPNRIIPDEDQVRKTFEEEDLAELADAIEKDGQEQPGMMYRIYGDPDHDFKILDAERRWRSCLMKNLPFIGTVVKKPKSRSSRKGRQVTLNMGRVGHDHMEIILAIQDFLEDGNSLEWIARKFVKSLAWVQNYVRAATLPGLVIEMLSSALPDNERLRFPVALLLLKFPSQLQLEIARQVRGKPMPEASRIISRELGEEAPESGVRKERPSDRRGTVEKKLDGAISGLRQLEDMTQEEISRMLQNISPETRQAFLDSVVRTSELASAATDRVKACLPGAQKAEPARRPVPAPVRAAHAAPASPMQHSDRSASVATPPRSPVTSGDQGLHWLETARAGEVQVAPSSAPVSPPPEPAEPAVVLRVHGLVQEVDPGLEAMLTAMHALSRVIEGQEKELRALFVDMAPAKRHLIFDRTQKLAENLAKLRLWSRPSAIEVESTED